MDLFYKATNRWKLYSKRFKLEIRRNFLSVKAAKQWNNLPPKVIDAPLVSFKERLDSHLSRMI